MIAGDSLLVMASLLEKEGLGGQVQTIYFDPPYGIKYKGNWQLVTDDMNVKDGKAGVSSEPEMVQAFRDTWRKDVHSYLSYMRDRLLLCRDLLAESGSLFIQIGSDNVLRVGLLLDEIFGVSNKVSMIAYQTTGGGTSKFLPGSANYLLWYAKNKLQTKYHQLYEKLTLKQIIELFTSYARIEMPDGSDRNVNKEERESGILPENTKLFKRVPITSQGHSTTGRSEPYIYKGIEVPCVKQRHWSVSQDGMDRLAELGRLHLIEGRKGPALNWKWYSDEVPGRRINDIWHGQFSEGNKQFVVQTDEEVIQRCILMTSDPGDLVVDPTCGSGTTAYVAEKWGRRWITIDTSRVALTIARRRLLTAVYPYYELRDGISPAGGFVYENRPRITPKTLAYDLEPETIDLVDLPKSVARKRRVSGWFTIEALPAPYAPHPVLPLSENGQSSRGEAGASGEGMDDWRDWLEQMRRSGVRTVRNGKIRFEELAEHAGGQWIHAAGVLEDGKVCVVVFGSPYAPLSGFQVEQAIEEAQSLVPRPEMVLFTAFGFDSAATELLGRKNWPGVELVRALIDADLLVTDLKGAQPGDDVFWLVGQPDVDLQQAGNDIWQIKVIGFDYYDHQSNQVIPRGVEEVALWSLDSNYDGKSLFPSQIFFPNARTDKEGWGSLAKTLGATIDEDLLEWYHGDISLPFEASSYRRAAVKIVDRRGVESMVVIPLPESKQVGRGD